ncbi:unnamed protein product [Brassicogethes aeneus]|uniref:Regulatory protein zeste n=1 Tax=Brassicogethes aeneus TaxID=1431903 RepID=A0A9P0BJ04_BRAAE|nr:unnamed protein product [Brassicogethes aeneus]
MNRGKKSTSITETQKTTLIEFLKNNPLLISGKFSNSFTFKDATAKWVEITEVLNSIPGAIKDWRNWRKTWQDLRSRTKLKKSEINKHHGGTGGGPPTEKELTPSEISILDIVKAVSIEGHKVPESPANFNFEETDKIVHDLLNENQKEQILVVQKEKALSNKENIQPSTSQRKIPEKALSNKENIQPSTSQRKIPKRSKISNGMVVNEFNTLYKQKIQIKESYYNKKIELLTRIAVAKEKSATSIEKIADTLTELTYNLT